MYGQHIILTFILLFMKELKCCVEHTAYNGITCLQHYSNIVFVCPKLVNDELGIHGLTPDLCTIQ